MLSNLSSFFLSLFQGSNARKMYFMIFERGPRAFIHGTIKLIRVCVAEGSSMQHLCRSAASHISERIKVLSCLQSELAIFLAQVCLTSFFLFESAQPHSWFHFKHPKSIGFSV